MATQDSIFKLLNKPSYSGTDIRVYARIYDNGFNINNDIRGYEAIAKDAEAEAVKNSDLQQADKLFATAEAARREAARLGARKEQDVVSLVWLEELQTLSVSLFREKLPVRACGSVNARGYTRGPRTIAGSMIFTIFDEHVLKTLLTAAGSLHNDVDIFTLSSTTLSDQLPPIDLQVEFANEYGDTSIEVVYGVEFVNDGHTMSIEDLLLENTFQWVGRDIDHMRPLDSNKLTDSQFDSIFKRQGTTGRQLLRSPNMKEYLARANPYK